jgi:hypothetical protein
VKSVEQQRLRGMRTGVPEKPKLEKGKKLPKAAAAQRVPAGSGDHIIYLVYVCIYPMGQAALVPGPLARRKARSPVTYSQVPGGPQRGPPGDLRSAQGPPVLGPPGSRGTWSPTDVLHRVDDVGNVSSLHCTLYLHGGVETLAAAARARDNQTMMSCA